MIRFIRWLGSLFTSKPTEESFELYRHELQESRDTWIPGRDLERHLHKTGMMDRCLYIEHPLVQDWLCERRRIPEKLKGKKIFLWKSRRRSGQVDEVPYLFYAGTNVLLGRDTVILNWETLDQLWSNASPALLSV